MAMNGHMRSASSQQRRQGLLKDQLRLVKRRDCDRFEIEQVPDPLSFEKGIFLFIRACQLLSQKIKGVILVGLAGPSGAGKTVFSEKVNKFMPGITVISMDNYNDGSRIVDGNYDDPRLTDYDLLLKNISDLKAGMPVEAPIYDFKLSCRTGFRKVEVPTSRIVIIEGIYALSEKLRPLLDLRVSVTGGVHFDLVKRVLRDIDRSCQAPEDIIQQVSETVYPMYKAFIEPDLETAHIKIVNKFNPFSGLQSPTYILKSSRIFNEDQIRGVLSPGFTEAMEDTYDIYLLPPGEDPETCQSYLRMRNRDGKYSLMFEECLIAHPFIISPRITFEVSVRLLGGLMALGYTIATILKRVSQVYTDDNISIKVDKLELLQQKFIQVQGRSRSLVETAAKKLGLEGSYVPHPYIEQIQFEKLGAEVMAIPDDLKTKLSLVDTPSSSPVPSFSWMSETQPGVKNLYSKSWTKTNKDTPLGFSAQSKGIKQHSMWDEPTEKRVDERCLDSPTSLQGEQGYGGFSEQLTGLNERIDELLVRLGEVEIKLSSSVAPMQSRQGAGVGFTGAGNGSVPGNPASNGLGAANGFYSSMTTVPLTDLPVVAELRSLAQGQWHLTTQLDIVCNILQQNLGSGRRQHVNERGLWDTFARIFNSSNDTVLMTALGITVLGLGGLAGFFKVRSSTN
ncbi:hypothetical protein L7F22_057876 [Adiantum nelumboides]|nr:hypothetical protein [Adiantum nelumboides]